MNSELEESIRELESLSPSETAIKTVLQALEKLQKRCKELIKEKQDLTSALLDSIPKKKIEDKIKELKEKKKYAAEPELPPHTFGISQHGITPYHAVISMITIDGVEKMLEELLEEE